MHWSAIEEEILLAFEDYTKNAFKVVIFHASAAQ